MVDIVYLRVLFIILECWSGGLVKGNERFFLVCKRGGFSGVFFIVSLDRRRGCRIFFLSFCLDFYFLESFF